MGNQGEYLVEEEAFVLNRIKKVTVRGLIITFTLKGHCDD